MDERDLRQLARYLAEETEAIKEARRDAKSERIQRRWAKELEEARAKELTQLQRAATALVACASMVAVILVAGLSSNP